MGSFLKIQNILAQMVWGSTKPSPDEPEQGSDDAEETSDEPKTESDETPPVSDTADDPLADSRNRVPTLGGPYGMVLPSGGWRRT